MSEFLGSALILLAIFMVAQFLILTKHLLKWLFLWQNKEYRLDKMRDYLSLPESKKVIFDIWTVLHIINVCLFIAKFTLKNIEVDTIYNFGVLYIILICTEATFFLFKIFSGRKILKPKFTPKTIVLCLISCFTVFVVSLTNQPLIVSVIVIFMPFIVGFSILLTYPIDYFFKNRLFHKALSQRRRLDKLKVVAISGAFGKTTTKEILATLLSKRYNVEKTQKNENTGVSCAKKMISLDSESDYFLCEIGAYKKGEGTEICNFIQPSASIITGLNHQHFSLFGSVENIILAESESVNFLKPGESVIINWSSKLCRKIQIPKNLKVIKCGIDNGETEERECDYFVKNIKSNENGTEFDLVLKHSNSNEVFDGVDLRIPNVKTNLLSTGNIENILLCLAFCVENGFKIDEIIPLLQNLSSPAGRLEKHDKEWGSVIYNQYNNTDGVRNALELIQDFNNNKIVIVDDIMELGKESAYAHQKMADQIINSKPSLVILLGKSFYKTIEDQIRNSNSEFEILHWNGKNTTEIKQQIRKNIEVSKKKTTLLLLGFQSKNFLNI